jgi:two-component system, NarL family, response regulator YdfI
MTRVVIGVPSAVLRANLESVLGTKPEYQLIGSYSVDGALAHVARLQPDIILLDSGSSAHEIVAMLLEPNDELVSSTMVILTDEPDTFLATDAIRAGIRALLPRDARPEEILSAIRASLAGLFVMHPDTLESLLQFNGENHSELAASDQILTPREIEVLRMIAEGLGNKDIASKLGISDHTVKFHISSMFAKLGAANRAEAVTLGIRLGLLMV